MKDTPSHRQMAEVIGYIIGHSSMTGNFSCLATYITYALSYEQRKQDRPN